MIPLEAFKPKSRWSQLRHAVLSAKKNGLWAEFGTASGKTAGKILEHMPKFKQLHLFDSFHGLPETWQWNSETGEKIPKGHFSTGGVPPSINDPRVEFHIGMFHDTVAKWAAKQMELMAFVHIDSDLYSSCVTVLKGIGHRLGHGTVIQFDEIQGFPGYEHHEYKAWIEFTERTGWEWRWLSRTVKYRAAVILGLDCGVDCPGCGLTFRPCNCEL